MNEEERDQRILDFIRIYQQAYPGLSPSYREIAEAVGLRSTSTVYYHLRRLEGAGQIETGGAYDQHRGIGLVDSIVVTQQDAKLIGLDWNKLLVLKYAGRKLLEKPNGS